MATGASDLGAAHGRPDRGLQRSATLSSSTTGVHAPSSNAAVAHAGSSRRAS